MISEPLRQYILHLVGEHQLLMVTFRIQGSRCVSVCTMCTFWYIGVVLIISGAHNDNEEEEGKRSANCPHKRLKFPTVVALQV